MKFRILVISAIAVIVISFSFVFVPGKETPYLLSMPFILWSGLLATIILVVLTFLGAKYFKSNDQ